MRGGMGRSPVGCRPTDRESCPSGRGHAQREWRLASEMALREVALDRYLACPRVWLFDFGEVSPHGSVGVKCLSIAESRLTQQRTGTA